MNGISYNVINKSIAQDSFNELRYLNNVALTLFDYFKRCNLSPANRQMVATLKRNYGSLHELPANSSNIAFIQRNWQPSLHICLLNKHNRFATRNEQIYIFIHELAHLGTLGQKHSPQFIQTFKFLLNAAVYLKLYYPINYRIYEHDYCGKKISSNILFQH